MPEPDFPRLKAKRTFELIVDLLKEKVFAGEYRPGHRLPPERALAEQLGVSRTVVREAFRALELLGLVEIRKGAEGGAFIQEISPQSASRTVSDLLQLGQVSLSDLAEARLVIETGAVELAAARAQAQDWEELAAGLELARGRADQGRSVTDLSLEFHLRLTRLAGNPVLVLALSSILNLMHLVLNRLAPTPDMARHEIGEHQAILDALRQGRTDQAVTLMQRHLRYSMARLEELAGRRRFSSGARG